MTKIYSARPVQPPPPHREGKGYIVTAPGAQIKRVSKEPVPLGVMHTKRNSPTTYLTSLGYEHSLTLYVLDSASKRPLRSVKIETHDSVRGHTDRLGKLTLKLNHGSHQISLNGIGYAEAGAFTPTKVEFKPINFQIDLDSDETATIYTSGEIVQGEFHNPNNPHRTTKDLPLLLSENWQLLALVGGAGAIAYYLGSRTKGK